MLRTPIIFITNLLRIFQVLTNKHLLRGGNFKSIYRDMSIPVSFTLYQAFICSYLTTILQCYFITKNNISHFQFNQ